ncbi:hypothetical protein [Chromatium okenii]|jgi:hypothetical protein|uniref:hypothetical protein n=1 Tax=Chromatium okenii TaxID=61644 RepID=UPI0026E92C34|nr:hypothetical protein [Chromatium okenii]MBV5310362.1 hypothetical protein [Chromatium okenii]
MKLFSISGRQFNYQNIENALNFWQFYLHKFYDGGKIEAFFNSLKMRSPLYGGRPCNVEYSFSEHHVEQLNSKGIGVMLTLSNHYFTEDAYRQTIPILECVNHSLNSAAIVNDELARRIAEDFPAIHRKASVIKLISSLDEIHRALDLYHSVVLHPKLNDDVELLQSIDCKNQIILFANTRCLYKCEHPICYKSISKQMITQGRWDKQVCNYKDNRQAVEGYTIFDLNQEQFNGFTQFKLIPVPDKHLQLDYCQKSAITTSLMTTKTGMRIIR